MSPACLRTEQPRKAREKSLWKERCGHARGDGQLRLLHDHRAEGRRVQTRPDRSYSQTLQDTTGRHGRLQGRRREGRGKARGTMLVKGGDSCRQENRAQFKARSLGIAMRGDKDEHVRRRSPQLQEAGGQQAEPKPSSDASSTLPLPRLSSCRQSLIHLLSSVSSTPRTHSGYWGW